MANVASEQVIDPVPCESQLFTGLGTDVDVLQVQYDFENLSIWSGKIHSAIGRAWEVAPKFHGTNLGERVSLVCEDWSLGADYSFASADGENAQTASLKLSTEFNANVALGNRRAKWYNNECLSYYQTDRSIICS